MSWCYPWVRLVALHRYSLLTCILKPDPPAQSIMIFLKHFDTSKQTLYGAGKTYMLRNSKVGDLAPIINERMRWTPGTSLKLYEVTSTQTSDATVLTISHQEIKPGMIELMKLKLSFSQFQFVATGFFTSRSQWWRFIASNSLCTDIIVNGRSNRYIYLVVNNSRSFNYNTDK
jgi:hypothetical protein